MPTPEEVDAQLLGPGGMFEMAEEDVLGTRMPVFKQRVRPLRRDPIPDHAKVLDAIAAKDPQRARKRMSELIQLALQDTPAVNAPRKLKKTDSR